MTLYRNDLYAAFKYFLFPAREISGTELLFLRVQRAGILSQVLCNVYATDARSLEILA